MLSHVVHPQELKYVIARQASDLKNAVIYALLLQVVQLGYVAKLPLEVARGLAWHLQPHFGVGNQTSAANTSGSLSGAA